MSSLHKLTMHLWGSGAPHLLWKRGHILALCICCMGKQKSLFGWTGPAGSVAALGRVAWTLPWKIWANDL